jgi:protocatechuate 3,4-dioxygenase, alpha subunit
MSLPPTPSQTVGPFFGFALPWPDGPHAADPDAEGAIRISGRVLDGEGAPVPDALIETWQADPGGRFDHPDDPRGAARWAGGAFRGFARCGTDAEGRYEIVTLKPGSVPAPDGTPQAPHLAVTVLARGLLTRLVTRIYFPEETEANAADPVLRGLPDDAARTTLVAARDGDGYRFDIRLQGDRETAFLLV